MALVMANRFDGTAICFASASFYFDEDEHVVVAANNIDFAPAAAMEIAVEDFKALLAEESGCELFAANTATQIFGFR